MKILLTNSEQIYLTVGLCAAGVIIIVALFFLICFLRKKKKTANDKKEQEVTKSKNSSSLKEALGGEENIVSHSLQGSRLTIVLKDYSKVNKETLKKLGIERILEMSSKIILVGKNIEDLVSFYKF